MATDNENLKGVSPISTYQSMLSDRDSDFDCYSAYGEVIDNSLQAFATKIDIAFIPRGPNAIEKLIFSDNGVGMNEFTLQRCIRLGWSSRYNDRSGIGRFGVGMTKGAIHECRRIEVYSKEENGEWFYTNFDFDEMGEMEQPDGENKYVIPEPIPKDPNEIDLSSITTIEESLIPKNHGTVVIWSKYDRTPAQLPIIINRFIEYTGRTFRYFIWDKDPMNDGKEMQVSQDGEKVSRGGPVTIKINGKLVDAIDPLYLTTEKTRFPNDPISEEWDSIRIPVQVTDPDLEVEEGEIIIRMALLPEEWRTNQGMGDERNPNASARYIHHNEGMSLVRAGREVSYDWINYWSPQSQTSDRFWGMEINFNPELDQAFTVKNIKRGANPTNELRKILMEAVNKTIRTFRERIKDTWAVPTPQVGAPEGGGGHDLGTEIVTKTPSPRGTLPEEGDKKREEDAAAAITPGRPEDAQIWIKRFRSQPFTIKDDAWPGSTFMEITHMGGSDLLQYNTRHQFINVLRNIQLEIADGVNEAHNANRLNALIDITMMAYGKAQSMIDSEQSMTGKRYQETIIANWGQFLEAYISTWLEEFDKDLK